MAKKKTRRTHTAGQDREPAWPDPFPIPTEKQASLDHFGDETYERFQRDGWGNKPLQNLSELETQLGRRDSVSRVIQNCTDPDRRREHEFQFEELARSIDRLTQLIHDQLNLEVWDRNGQPQSDEERAVAILRASFDLTSQEGVRETMRVLIQLRSRGQHGGVSTVADPEEQRRRLERRFARTGGILIRAIYKALPVSVDGQSLISANQIAERLADQLSIGCSASSVTRGITELHTLLGDEIQKRRGGGGGAWKTRDLLDDGDA